MKATLIYALAQAAAWVVVFLAPRPFDRIARRCRPAVERLARRPLMTCALAGLVGVVPLLLGLALRGAPNPAIHDEFAYLLAGDTFMHGRLTNPPHPHWPFFDTFHVIQRPTYASKYPPSQGLFIALGRVVSGHPYGGILLGVFFACAAIARALFAWLPPRWAVAGSVLVAAHPIWLVWGSNYMGGALAAGFGALVLAGFGSACRRGTASSGVAAAIGAVGLALTRPLEGIICCATLSLVFGGPALARLRQRGTLARALAVTGIVLVAGGAWFGLYNRAVTGRATVMPYAVWFSQYGTVPSTLTDGPGLKEWYRLPQMRSHFFSYEGDAFALVRGMSIPRLLRRSGAVVRSFVTAQWLLLAGLIALPVACGADRRTRRTTLAYAIFVAAFTSHIWVKTQYFAPGFAILLLGLMQALRWSCSAAPSHAVRRASRAALAAGTAAAIIWPIWLTVATPPAPMPFGQTRAAVLEAMMREPGRHLVFVRYPASHVPFWEWVYNGADIDGQKVVWAHDLGSAENETLIRSMADRRIWLLEADTSAPKPVPYSREGRRFGD
jgi:hypothetical protein